MKRWVIILLGVLGTLLLGALLIYLLQDAIVGYALRKAVNWQANGNVELSMESTRFSFRTRSVVILRPELEFKNAKLDSTGELQLNRIVFEKLELDSLSLLELWSDKSFIARKLIIGKPEIYFTDKSGTTQSSLQPERFLELISSDTAGSRPLALNIGTVEIRYGSINLAGSRDPDNPAELLDFTVILKNLNTRPAPGKKEEQIFFSDDLLLEIKNLRRVFISGYDLKIEAASFSTREKRFSLTNALFRPVPIDQGQGERARIAFGVSEAELIGIDLQEIRGQEILDLESIKLSEGHFNLYQAEKTGKDKREGNQQQIDLPGLFQQVRVDTLDIRDFDFNELKNPGDTTITISGASLSMHEIRVDSGAFDDPLEKIHFKDFFIHSGRLKARLEKQKLLVSYDELDYATTHKEATIHGMELLDISSDPKQQPLQVSIRKTRISDIHHEKIRKGEMIFITVKLDDPDMVIDLQHPLFKPSSHGKSKLHMLFDIAEIEVNNGNFEITDADRLWVTAEKFNGYARDIETDKLHNIDLRPVRISTGKLQVKVQSGPSISFRSFSYENQSLVAQKLSLSLPSEEVAKNNELTVNNLIMHGFDPERLRKDHTLVAEAIAIDRPSFTGEIRQKPVKNSTGQYELPFNARIERLDMVDGRLDFTFSRGHEDYHFKTSFETDVNILQFSQQQHPLDILKSLDISTLFHDLEISFPGHQAQLDTLVLDLDARHHFIRGLQIIPQNNSISSLPVRIDSLELDVFEISGLNHRHLFDDGIIQFQDLWINKLDGAFHILEASQDSSAGGERYREITRLMSSTEYRTINLSGINLRVSTGLGTPAPLISLKGLQFRHDRSGNRDNNLVNDLVFNFERFTLVDTLKNISVSLKEVKLNPESMKLAIQDIDAGSFLGKSAHDPLRKDQGGMQFNSSGFIMHGIFIKNSFPTHVSINKIDFDKVYLSITQKPVEGAHQGLRFDIDIFRQWAYLMTAFNIDTAHMEDFRVRVHSITGDTTRLVWSDSLGLTIEKIRIDTNMFGIDNPDVISTVSIELKNRKIYTPDSLHILEAGNLRYSFPDRKITIDTFRLIPRYEPDEFFDRAFWQTERMQITGGHIVCEDFRINQLLEENHLHFGSIRFQGLHAELLRDKRYPREPGVIKKMPARMLRDLKQKVTIDTLAISDAYLMYGEISEKSDIPGQIFLDRMNLKAYNITNDYGNLRSDDLRVTLNAHIMGDARMEVAALFPLQSMNDEFTFSAVSETIDLTELSKMTTHIMGLAILRGKGSINAPGITGNDSIATGQLTFRYKKLRIALYDRKKEQLNRKFGVNFMNFMINDIVLQSNNPKFARKPRIGQVYFERDREKSIVNYMWKSLMSGMLSTMGFNNKAQRQARRSEPPPLER